MSNTPEFVAEVATGFPAVPLPGYDQTIVVVGCTDSGTYEPRPWGSSADIAAEYVAGPAARDARHLVSRTNLGLLVQRVESTTPGSYDTIDNSAFAGTAVPATVAGVVPRDEGELYIRFATGGTVGTDGITYYASDDNGRLGADELFRLGTLSRITFAAINAAIDLLPAASQEAVAVAHINELVTDFQAHAILTTGGVHGVADPAAPYTIGTAADYASAYSVFGQLRTSMLAHVATVAATHGAADTTATAAITSIAVPTTPNALIDALVAIKLAFFGTPPTVNTGHTQRTTSAIHGAQDATNLVTSPAPALGTVIAGAVIRCGTFAPAWGNAQLATAFQSIADSDHEPSMVLLSGRVLPTSMPTITTGLGVLEAAGKRCLVVSQARKKTNLETAADWRAALTTEWQDSLDYRVAACAGDGLATFTDGTKTLQYARGFSTQAMRRLMQIDRFRTAWEVELGRLEDFTISDANGIVIGHDERTSPGLKNAKFWTVYRPSSSTIGRVAFLNFDITRYEQISRVRSARVNRITNRMILEIQAVGLSILGKIYDVFRLSPTTGTLSQKAIDALVPRFAAPIKNGFQNDISDWRAPDLIVIGSSVAIDSMTDAFDLVVTINYTPKLPVGRVSATFAVRLGV
jgi:hypothetical protein